MNKPIKMIIGYLVHRIGAEKLVRYIISEYLDTHHLRRKPVRLLDLLPGRAEL